MRHTSKMSNLPDGLSRWAMRHIDGPDYEGERTVYCKTCEVEVVITVTGFAGDDWLYGTCDFCHSEIEVELPEPDYEAIAEARAEAREDEWHVKWD